MKRAHNPRHERFCREFIKLGNATEAYRRVYKGKAKDYCFQPMSSLLLSRPKIKQRIEELRMEIKRKSDITFEKILNDYQTALDMAKADRKPGEITSAATAQAKLVGLIIERRELGNVGDFDNMENVSEILNAVKEQAGPEVALALSKAFGVAEAIESSAPAQETEALLEAKPGSDAVN